MKTYWLISDTHGDYTPYWNFYNSHKDQLSENWEDNIIITLGDFGANYFLNKRDDFYKEKLHKLPLNYFCIRGNHEERPSKLMENYPSDWHIEIMFENKVYVEDRWPKIHYALDEGGEYNINGKSVLIIPGAYSVDKWYRLSIGWSYFFEEQLNKQEQENILNHLKGSYDYIFAHTCPQRWMPYISDLFLPQVNQSTVDRTTELFLDDVIARTFFDHFYFGHFHDNRDIDDFATMIFHEAIPFGSSYAEELKKQLS